jgi:hypothetical protein
MNPSAVTTSSWYPLKRILFRFCFVYFFIYCFPFPFDAFEFTKPVVRPFYNALDQFVPYIAGKWFHTHAVVAFPMFDKLDDSNYGLAFCYLNLFISTIVSVAWSLLDRENRNYEKLYHWLRLYLRYFLAAYLFGYGFVKVFPSQFQAISASRLSTLVGDQSPMLLAWNFMGYSSVMMRINGMAEVMAGLLLLFRRTTTIGAILSACVFSFVVLMDFCFNVPVRLLASHLLVISIFLVLEDWRKLANVFLLNRPADSTDYLPLIARSGWRKVFRILQAVLAVSILCSGILSALKAEKEYGWNTNSKVVPLYGIYNTTYFIKNGDTIPPFETDSTRWKQLVIDGGNWQQFGVIRFSTGKKLFYNIHADTVKKIITLQSQDDTTQNYRLHYSIRNKKNLLIKGFYGKDSIEALMKQYDLNNYLLYREKFTWITE